MTADLDDPGLSSHALRTVAADLRQMAREASNEAVARSLLHMSVRFVMDLAEQEGGAA